MSEAGPARLESLLLDDAVDQALASPAAVHGWHALTMRFNATKNSGDRARCVQRLMSMRPLDGVSGFLRAEFLSVVAEVPGFSTEASRELLAIEPFHAERLVAFADLEWARLLAACANRSVFAQGLRQARLPEIIAKLGLELTCSAKTTWSDRWPTDLRKVALVTPMLSNRAHTPTTLVLEHARLLREAGSTVSVFACQEVSFDHKRDFLPNGLEANSPPVDLEFVRKCLPKGASASIADTRLSLMRRWRVMLGAISAFDPDVVLFVGLYSPMIVALFERRPVVALSVNTLPAIVPQDVWLAADEAAAGRTNDAWRPVFPAALGCHYPFRIGANPGRERVPRDELGVPEDAVVLVTVGYRLAAEVAGRWAERMVALLRDNPNVSWLLVGGGEVPQSLATAPPGRVRALPDTVDVRGILRSCDVYVNPPRMGGGFSVAEAMAEALPVLSHADTDGGDKVGAAAFRDDEAYFSRLEALLGDGELRRSAGAEMKARFDRCFSLRGAVPVLRTALGTALERFRERKAAAESKEIAR